MTEFSLFRKLLDPNTQIIESVTKKLENAPKIRYQQYEVDIDKQTITVNIPIRECDEFEAEIANLSESLTESGLRNMLRKFRGIKD